MPPCNCQPPFPRPEPFSPLPRPGKVPDWGKWIRDRLAEKGALLVFPSASAFPDPGAQPNVYEALDTGALYRWDGAHYQVMFDPESANDVLEYEDRGRFPETGRAGVVYIDASANLLYRWDGTGYVPLTADLSGVESRLADVESKVPAQATAQNQLADKAFVNSSVATNTANYIYKTVDGRHVPFDSLAELQEYAGALTNNDYAFVVGADAAGNTTYTRYKWNGGTEAWAEEYVLNNSSFTAEQWAAINSGITSGLVTKLGALPTMEGLTQALAGKLDTTEGVLNALGYVYSDWNMSAFPATFQSSQPQAYHNEVINKYEWGILTGGVVVSDEKYDTEADALAALSITLRGPQLPDGAVATRTRTATSYRLGTAGGPNAGKPLQPAGDYALKASPTTAGNLAALDANGGIVDSGVKASDKLDASDGVASGLVVAFGNYGIRWSTRSSTEYTLELVYRPSESSSWSAIRTFYIPQATSGNLALIEQVVGKAIEAIAPEFSILYSYKVGQLVRKDGILYICTTAHPMGTQWDPSHFQANATVESALAVIRAAIPYPSTSTPNPDGTGSPGSASFGFSCGNHVHPSDSKKLDKSGGSVAKIEWVNSGQSNATLLITFANGKMLAFDYDGYSSDTVATRLWIAAQGFVNRLTSYFTPGNLASLTQDGGIADSTIPAANVAQKGNIPYDLVAKTIDNGAVTLDDRAINAVAVSSSLASLTINFPTATSGKARDFGLRLTVASGITTAPELALPQGVTCENADGEAPEIGADGAATILYFTETASGVFLVKGEVLQTITQA